jgi:two-component system sensor histidine kinase/response regulator
MVGRVAPLRCAVRWRIRHVTTQAPLSRRTVVWLVDDDAVHAETCAALLADDHDVDVFADGAALLKALATSPRPDLLLLDWHMPGMSGLEVCRRVRAQVGPLELPIAFVTASASQENLLEGLSAGANDYVRKPVVAAELTARVNVLVRSAVIHARLASAEQELRLEADMRERFIAILAHDLRQPLGAIHLGLSFLQRYAPDPSRVAPLIGAADRMQRMIAQLLDMARARRRSGMPIQAAPCDLARIAAQVVDEVRSLHPDRTIELRITGDATGSWDPDRLAQVCGNLLDNAISHGRPGRPVVASLVGDAGGVSFSVSNESEPMAPESLRTLFQPFRGGQSGVSRGLGLGLYIVDQIARAHGGTVTATSDETETRFVVTLPRRRHG